MTEPSLSAMMAVYAGVEPAHLMAALEGLADQTRPADEVLVVADGPLTDGLDAVLADFAPPRLPLRILRLSVQSGSGPARQAAVEAAASTLLAVADADDISLPERFETQVRLLRALGADLVGSAVEEFDAETSTVVGVRRFPEAPSEVVRLLRTRNPVNHPTMMARRAAVLAAGGYHDLPLLEDYDLCARMAGNGAVLANSPHVLVRFRGGAASQSRRRAPGSFRSEVALQRNLHRYGLIPAWQVPTNLTIRTAYRVLPEPLLRRAYARLFLESGEPAGAAERPEYDTFCDMSEIRGPRSAELANQALVTAGPWLSRPPDELDVLDVGSGYGHTAAALAGSCRTVVGLEPSALLHEAALALAGELRLPGLSFWQGTAEGLEARDSFDLVVLDNVYEHIPDQPLALEHIWRALRPGGVLFVVVPNKLWPMEAHYRLPGLSWLPLPVANAYLRASGRGRDYSDASYAPTYWGLSRALRKHGTWSFHFVLPGVPEATIAGTPVHYRLGMWLLRRVPAMWSISKALVVVAVKPRTQT